MSTSSIQAECITVVTIVGYGLHLRSVWQEVTNKKLPSTIAVDSLSLHKTLATQGTPKDMGTSCDIHSLRMDYESGLIDVISWIPGKKNPADP